MKKTFLLIYGLQVFISVATAVSCVEGGQKLSKTELLTARSWRLAKIEIQSESNTVDASVDYLMNCEKDNVITFTKAGGYSENTGSDHCDMEATLAGNWSWKEDETILSKTAGDNLEEDMVVEMSRSSFTLNVGRILLDKNGDGTEDAEGDLLYTYTAI